ncbi:MAG: histidinol-phosphate transaminase [Kiritimatiellia bacterium]
MICKNVQALTAYTPGEQPDDSSVIKLNTNENPYGPSPDIEELLKSFDTGLLRLYPDPVSMKVRERIAWINGCNVNQVFVGNGSDEILALCTRALVENDGSIGYFDPSYSLYPVLTDIRGVEKRPVSLNRDFTWRMPETYSADLFFITNPNAPTSMMFDRRDIADFAAAFEGVVLIDEAYVDFADENCMDMAVSADNRNVLVMRTLSKSFSLAGIRFGYAVGPENLITALYKIKDSYNMDMLTLNIGLAALNDLEYMRGNVSRIVQCREKLRSALDEKGWTVCPSQTNFLFARPPDGDAERIFSELKEKKIYVRYFSGDATGEFLRISIGTETQCETLLEAL